MYVVNRKKTDSLIVMDIKLSNNLPGFLKGCMGI